MDLPLPELATGASVASAWYTLQYHAAGLPVTTAVLAGITSGGIVALAGAVAIRGTLRTLRLLRGEPAPEVVVSYVLPPWPVSDKINFVLGENHRNLTGEFVSDPDWLSFGPAAMSTGCLILGATGGSKTAGVLVNIINQCCAFAADNPELKTAGLYQDYKSALVAPVKEAMEAAGRLDDLIVLGPTTERPVYFNPVHQPAAQAKVIGGQLLSAAANISGAVYEGQTAWIGDGTARLAESVIECLRLSSNKPGIPDSGYVTLAQVDRFVADMTAAITADEGARDGEPAGNFAALCEGLAALFETTEPDEMTKRRFGYALQWLTTDFRGTDSRYRNIYTSALQGVTQYFTMPAYSHLYSPREEDINLPTFEEILETGKVVVLDCNQDQHGALGNALGIFMKLAMMRATLSRPARCAQNPALNNLRHFIYLVDEFQEFVSSSDGASGGSGDDVYAGLCRASKVCMYVATQGRSSIVRKIGEDKTTTLFSNLRTKIFLALTEPKDLTYAADVIGKDFVDIQSTQVSEQVEDAEQSAGRFIGESTSVAESKSVSEQERYLVQPIRFKSLETFTAYVSPFDGISQQPPVLVRLKAYWRPREETYPEFDAYFRELNGLPPKC